MPLPGEEQVHDRPVTVTVFLDRRGPRDGSPRAAPPAVLVRELPLDRREEPRVPASLGHVDPVLEGRGPTDEPVGFVPLDPVAKAAAFLMRHFDAVPAPAPELPEAERQAQGHLPSEREGEPRVASYTTPAGSAQEEMPPEREGEPRVKLFASPMGPAQEEMPPEREGEPLVASFATPVGLAQEEMPPEQENEVAEELVLPPAPPVWRRLLAWGIDGALVVALPLVALGAATRGATGEDGAPLRFLDLLTGSGPVQAAAVGLGVVIAFVYLTLSTAVGGRTPGAALAGLEVTCASGASPTPGRAALRSALAVVGCLAFFVGPISALLDRRGRAVHDKLAGTVVTADCQN